MTVDILFLVKPLVGDTPKLKMIVRVEHVKGDTQVRVLAPVLIHHLLPQASVQKYQIINPRARVRSTVERPEVKTVKTDVSRCLLSETVATYEIFEIENDVKGD